MNNNWEIHIQDVPGTFTKQIFITRKVGDKMQKLNKDFNLIETFDPFVAQPLEPTFKMDNDIFQMLVDKLSKDYKPSEGRSFTEGKMEIMERYLEDMRTLVFKKK